MLGKLIRYARRAGGTPTTHAEEANKRLTREAPIRPAPLPEQLILPLAMHIGQPARALVKPGDRVLRGQRIARADGFVSAPVHASTSGVVRAIEARPVPHPSGLSAPCIVIDVDGLDEPAEVLEPYPDYLERDPLLLRNRVREAGIVGLGGAVFPSAVKLAVPAHEPIHTVILNGAECEDYITCDDRLMRERAPEVIEGALVLMHMTGAGQCLIGVEDNKPEAMDALNQVIRLFGETRRIQVRAVPSQYPAGAEKQLIRTLTGKEIPRERHASEEGIVGQNVATAAAIWRAVVRGEPMISRVVTLTGRGLREAGNWDVRLGTPTGALIERVAGGYAPDVARLLMGGPMMGIALHSDEVPVVKASNCFLALCEDEVTPTLDPMPCIRCGACAEACPVQLLPQQLYWFSRGREFDKAEVHHLFDCIECGCCATACPSNIPLVQYFRFAKNEIWAQERERLKAAQARERHEFRLARIEREKREREDAMARKREALAAAQSAAQSAAQNSAHNSDDNAAPSADEARQAAIQAAMARARARKEAIASAAAPVASTPVEEKPAATAALSEEQLAKIREAKARRDARKVGEAAPASAVSEPAPVEEKPAATAALSEEQLAKIREAKARRDARRGSPPAS